MITQRQFATGCAAMVAAVVTLAACGSGSSDDASPATSAAAGATSASQSSSPSAADPTTPATGEPLVVYGVAPIDTPTGSFPGVFAAMQAAATAINDKGGINGRPVEVKTCNGQFNPNQELACATEAAESTAIAVVGPLFVTNAKGALDVLAAAGMADLGGAAATPDELRSPIAFPLDAGTFTPLTCLGMVEAGLVTKVATVASDIGPIKANAALVSQAAPALGITVTEQVTLPPDAPDVTAQVKKVTDSGADGVIMFANSAQAAQVLQASAQLPEAPTFCSSDGLLAGGQLATLGAAAGDFYVGATMPPLSAADTNPAVAQFITEMKAQQDSGDDAADLSTEVYSSTSMRAWAGMQAFAQVAGSISGDITRTSFLDALRTSTDVKTGIFEPIDFTKPVGGAAFPSIYNPKTRLLKWDVDTSAFVATDVSFDVTTVLPPS